jgi:uncharacterized membrane protein YkoI
VSGDQRRRHGRRSGTSALVGESGTNPAAGPVAAAFAAGVAAGDCESRPNGGDNDRGSSPVRSDEKTLSASLTATLKQKALAAVPGGTVYRVEADSGDATYEAHMTKADGTEVTVKFDSSNNVTGIEAGMGK